MKCERCGEVNPAEIHTCSPQKPVAYMHIPHDDKLEIVFTPHKFNHKIYKSITPVYTAPPQRERIVFPTMLRKMWSGTEVQAWLDENVNKEKNT